MAFDIYGYFNQLNPSQLTNGLSANQAASVAQGLMNKLSANPNDQAALQQMGELFGPTISNQLIQGYQQNQQPTPPPSTTPSVTNSPATGPTPNQLQPPTVGSIGPNGTPIQSPGTPGSGTGFNTTSGRAVTFGSPTSDMVNIENAGLANQQLSLGTLNTQQAANQKYLSDLSGLLQQQQAQSMNEKLPGVYEDLNTRGLLRSSGLGNELATQAKNLTAETSNQLAQQGLAFQSQYTSGLGGITNNYESMLNQALNRGLTLEDFNNQVGASQMLGYALQPTQPNNSKSQTGAAMTGIGNLASGASALAAK